MALKIGELLIQHGLLTREQLDHALATQQSFGGKLGTNLVELKFITDTDLAEFLSRQLHLPAATPDDLYGIPRSVLDLVPSETAAKYKLIPVRLDKKLVVAISDPSSLPALDEVCFKTGKSVSAIIAPEIWIVAALERFYGIARETRYVNLDGDQGEKEISNVFGSFREGRDAAIVGGYVEESTAVSLQAYVDRLLTARNKEDVLVALLDFLAGFYPQAAVYVLRKAAVGGFMVRGFPVHAREFALLQVALSVRSLVRTVLEEKKIYCGAVLAGEGNETLFSALKIPAGRAVEIHPVLYRGKGVAAVLGLPDHPIEDVRTSALIDLALRKAGFALEWMALKEAIAEIPQ